MVYTEFHYDSDTYNQSMNDVLNKEIESAERIDNGREFHVLHELGTNEF